MGISQTDISYLEDLICFSKTSKLMVSEMWQYLALVKTTFPILLVGLALLSYPKAATAQNGDYCPPGSESSLDQIQSVLDDSAWADARQELGISVSADRARVLSDDRDPEVCQSLSKKFPDPDEKTRSFYKAGPHYFVIYEWETQSDGTINIGGAGFIVLGEDLEVLRFYVK